MTRTFVVNVDYYNSQSEMYELQSYKRFQVPRIDHFVAFMQHHGWIQFSENGFHKTFKSSQEIIDIHVVKFHLNNILDEIEKELNIELQGYNIIYFKGGLIGRLTGEFY